MTGIMDVKPGNNGYSDSLLVYILFKTYIQRNPCLMNLGEQILLHKILSFLKWRYVELHQETVHLHVRLTICNYDLYMSCYRSVYINKYNYIIHAIKFSYKIISDTSNKHRGYADTIFSREKTCTIIVVLTTITLNLGTGFGRLNISYVSATVYFCLRHEHEGI